MADVLHDFMKGQTSPYTETHHRFDNRWPKNAERWHLLRDNDGRDYDASVLSDDTEDSWDERVISNYRTGENDIMVSHKKIVSMHRQKCYRREQSAYVAELKAAGKVLDFSRFGQLPPELRLCIWEMHCPSMRSQRVLQLMLLANGSMHEGQFIDIAKQTKSTREFMRICQETRALGEQYMPDTLRYANSMHGDSILRYNAQRDIIHFTEETKFSLDGVRFFLDKPKASDGSDENTIRIVLPYTSVRNIAIIDEETRTRKPGTYRGPNYYTGEPYAERIRPGRESHRAPRELIRSGWSDKLDYLFPNVENVYALEYGGPRKIDRWIGHDRSYERYHMRTIDVIWSNKNFREYLYCWHGPPKGFRGRQSLPVDSKAASGGDVTKEVDEASPAKDTAEEDDGDFKDDCIINHFSNLRNKGVRFSRMLFFEWEFGMEDYYRLRSLTCPDGTWPNDENGGPWMDEKLRVSMDCPDFSSDVSDD